MAESDGMRRKTVEDYLGVGGVTSRMFLCSTGEYKDAIYKVIRPDSILRKGRDTFSLLVHFIGTEAPIRYFNPRDKEVDADDVWLAKQSGTNKLPRRKRSK